MRDRKRLEALRAGSLPITVAIDRNCGCHQTKSTGLCQGCMRMPTNEHLLKNACVVGSRLELHSTKFSFQRCVLLNTMSYRQVNDGPVLNFCSARMRCGELPGELTRAIFLNRSSSVYIICDYGCGRALDIINSEKFLFIVVLLELSFQRDF